MIEKIFNFKNGKRVSKVKVCKQVRDQKSMQTSLRWSSVIIEQRDKRKINSKTFAITILTASVWLIRKQSE